MTTVSSTHEQSPSIQHISQKYGLSNDASIIEGMLLILLKRKRLILSEQVTILNRYQSDNAGELKQKIKNGSIPEHPAWEDCIELENIAYELNDPQDMPFFQKMACLKHG